MEGIEEEGGRVREGLRELLSKLQPITQEEIDNNRAKYLNPFSLILRYHQKKKTLFPSFSFPFFLNLFLSFPRNAAELARGSGLQNFDLKYELVRDGGAELFLSVLDDDRLRPLHTPNLLVIHKLTRHPDVAKGRSGEGREGEKGE